MDDLNKSVYPNETRSVKRLIFSSVLYWWQSLTAVAYIVPFLFVVSVLFEYTSYAHFPKEYAHLTQVVTGLLNVFFWSAGLLMLHKHMTGRPRSYRAVLSAITKKIPRLLGVLICYLLCGIAIYAALSLITLVLRGVFSIHSPVAAEILLMAAGLAYTFVMVLFFMVTPIVILEDINLICAFKRSALLSLRHWVRPFAAYLGVIAVSYFMLLPRLLAGIKGVTDFDRLLIQGLIGALLTPIIFSLILFVFNDLKVRLMLQQQRRSRAQSSD
jgi:hypothetical protein